MLWKAWDFSSARFWYISKYLQEPPRSKPATFPYPHHGLHSITLDILPLLNPNHTLQRLPQETLSSLQFLLIQIEIISSESGSHNECQLHLRNIASDTRSRSMTERNESNLLPISQVVPTIRVELVCIRSPDLLWVMDRVCWDREDGVRGEMLTEERDAVSGRHKSGQSKGRSRMDT